MNVKLHCKESCVPKNWCFWTVVLEKTLENSLDYKEIKPVSPKGNQSWIIIGRTDAEAETPILWPPDVKNWLLEKTLMLGKIEGRWQGWEADDRGWDGWMASPSRWIWVWVSSGSWWCTGKMAFCSPWGWKESDMNEQLNLTKQTHEKMLNVAHY